MGTIRWPWKRVLRLAIGRGACTVASWCLSPVDYLFNILGRRERSFLRAMHADKPGVFATVRYDWQRPVPPENDQLRCQQTSQERPGWWSKCRIPNHVPGLRRQRNRFLQSTERSKSRGYRRRQIPRATHLEVGKWKSKIHDWSQWRAHRGVWGEKQKSQLLHKLWLYSNGEVVIGSCLNQILSKMSLSHFWLHLY